MTGHGIIQFDPPTRLLNLNGRQHWARRAADVRVWRRAAWAAGVQAIHDGTATRETGFSTVAITLPVKGNLRRDPHNFVPTLKAVVDGLVDAGVFADDSVKHLRTLEPVLDQAATVVTVIIQPANETS